MKNTGKSLKSGGKFGQETRKDRRSGTGMSGSPKKGGHGGKFTWSGDGSYSPAELGGFDRAAVDVNDPNFESEKEEVVAAASASA